MLNDQAVSVPRPRAERHVVGSRKLCIEEYSSRTKDTCWTNRSVKASSIYPVRFWGERPGP